MLSLLLMFFSEIWLHICFGSGISYIYMFLKLDNICIKIFIYISYIIFVILIFKKKLQQTLKSHINSPVRFKIPNILKRYNYKFCCEVSAKFICNFYEYTQFYLGMKSLILKNIFYIPVITEVEFIFVLKYLFAMHNSYAIISEKDNFKK